MIYFVHMKSLPKVSKVPVRHSSNVRLDASQEQKLKTELGEVTFPFLPSSSVMSIEKEARETGITWDRQRMKEDKKLQIGCARGMITIYDITANLCYNKISLLTTRAYILGDPNEPRVHVLQGYILHVCVATDPSSTQGHESCVSQVRESQPHVPAVEHPDLELLSSGDACR